MWVTRMVLLNYLRNIAFNFLVGVMSMISNNSEGEAVLESPLYNRSAEGYGKCLQFRFLMFGAGAKTMEIYQDTNAYQRRVWKDSNNTVPHWRYGEVSFNSVASSKVTNCVRIYCFLVPWVHY